MLAQLLKRGMWLARGEGEASLRPWGEGGQASPLACGARGGQTSTLIPLPQSASGSSLGAGTMPSAALHTVPSSLISLLPTTMWKTSGMLMSLWGCNALFACDQKRKRAPPRHPPHPLSQICPICACTKAGVLELLKREARQRAHGEELLEPPRDRLCL